MAPSRCESRAPCSVGRAAWATIRHVHSGEPAYAPPCAIPTDLIAGNERHYLIWFYLVWVIGARSYFITKASIFIGRCHNCRECSSAQTLKSMNENGSFKCAHSTCSNALCKWQDRTASCEYNFLLEWVRPTTSAGGGRKPWHCRPCHVLMSDDAYGRWLWRQRRRMGLRVRAAYSPHIVSGCV